MTELQALLIGILQALTEFFPVSSSAHLKIARSLLGIPSGEGVVLFDLSCHLGTLLALVLYFRKEILQLFGVERKTLSLLLLALLPLFPAYFLLKPVREWASKPEFLGIALLITSGLLFFGDLWKKKQTSLSLSSQAFWIGGLQAAALIPGISRSGSTITCARLLGWDMAKAVRFSFLLSLPTILGGVGMEGLKFLISPPTLSTLSFSSCLIGFLSSCGVGLLMIQVAVARLERGNLKPFAWYCLAFGIFALIYYG